MLRRVWGISLALVMTTAVLAEAQLKRNVVAAGVLLPCCVVESQDAAGASLALKNTATGELLRVTTPSTRYRVGQAVDMNTEATRMALTPFPVEDQKKSPNMHQNDAWEMRSLVTISAEGRIDGQTRIESSDPQQGFTGGVEVLLLDRSTNILHQTNLRTYGVDANSARTVNWHETAPLNAVNKVRAVLIHHSYEPTTRLAASLGWINANAGDVSEVLTCIGPRTRVSRAIQCSAN